MSADAVDTDLRTAFKRYCSPVAKLNRNNLAILIEGQLASPDTTDREEVEMVLDEEWNVADCMSFYDNIKMPKNLYATLSDGTKTPLAKEERTQLLAQLEEDLKDHVATEFRPLQLPDDRKQLYALTNALEGPGMPGTNYGSIPHAFDGLSRIHICPEDRKKESCLDKLD